MPDPSSLPTLPITFQEIRDYFGQFEEAMPFALRMETFRRIELATGRPLVCYVTKTHDLPRGTPAHLDHSDILGFDDLAHTTKGDDLDVLIVSNGGSAEATERIVRLLRERYSSLRFIVPANAYSAATLMCFAGDDLVMARTGTLGPVDPQIDGIPARAILRAFDAVEERLR